ncbi:hypothetical protein [Cohnella abietis]|uniref:Sporulation protein Cse60 n=1 Tax=Cohnella abietis TaxID=2507935 RepID=A0A3T1CZX5_9BACL|nr:hypothetical protein [Cohnella abietis]BBI31378.1 hypothetical protein KCTCHS21_07770 [Cohnella abietis]
MVQVKEFVDTDSSLAEKRANEFLATLQDDQVINICYGSIGKQIVANKTDQRSAILVVYKTK